MLAIVIPYFKLTFFEETLQSLANLYLMSYELENLRFRKINSLME